MELPEIFQLETHLEAGFKGVLSGAGFTVYHSRETDIAVTPRIEVKAIVGEIIDHVHSFGDPRSWVYDCWNGSLEVTVTTNRESDKEPMNHRALLGLVRYRLQLAKIVQTWLSHQQTVVITDIREQGTSDSFTDEKNLDYSVLNWLIVFNVNPTAWPAVLT